MFEIKELLASRIRVSSLMISDWLATRSAKRTLAIGSNLIV